MKEPTKQDHTYEYQEKDFKQMIDIDPELTVTAVSVVSNPDGNTILVTATKGTVSKVSKEYGGYQ